MSSLLQFTGGLTKTSEMRVRFQHVAWSTEARLKLDRR